MNEIISTSWQKVARTLDQAVKELFYLHIDPLVKQWIRNFNSLVQITAELLVKLKGEKYEVPAFVLNVKLSEAAREALANGQETELVSGLISKAGKEFSAFIRLDDEGNMKFRFPSREENAVGHQDIGPKDGIKVPEIFLGVKLSEEQRKVLSEGHETDLVHGLKGKKGIPFSGYLKVDQNGRINIRFNSEVSKNQTSELKTEPQPESQYQPAHQAEHQPEKLILSNPQINPDPQRYPNLNQPIEQINPDQLIILKPQINPDPPQPLGLIKPDRQLTHLQSKPEEQKPTTQVKPEPEEKLPTTQVRPQSEEHPPITQVRPQLEEHKSTTQIRSQIEENKHTKEIRSQPEQQKYTTADQAQPAVQTTKSDPNLEQQKSIINFLKKKGLYGKSFSSEEISALSNKGRTPLLDGFESRNGKKFSAILELNGTKLQMNIPERKVNTGISRIPSKLYGVEISIQDRKKLEAGQVSSYITNMRTPEGILFNGWIKADNNRNLWIKSAAVKKEIKLNAISL